MKVLKKISLLIFNVVLLVSCNNVSKITPQYVYINEPESSSIQIVEYSVIDDIENKYVRNKINWQLRQLLGTTYYYNSYYDGQKFYMSIGNAIHIYDVETQKVKNINGYVSNAIKKIDNEIWLAVDNGLLGEGYSSKICKIVEDKDLDCILDVSNQQVTDFYFNFEENTLFAAGAGAGQEKDEDNEQYKIVKYDLETGKTESVRNEGNQILAGRLSNICQGQFITSDGDVYKENGEKIGEIIGTKGQKLMSQINDLEMNTTAFLDSKNKLMELYGCDNNKIVHLKTINLEYEPNIFPAYHSWETADNGEISMPIQSKEEFFDFIGIQSVNLRTGEVKITIFDEPIRNLHGVARFM